MNVKRAVAAAVGVLGTLILVVALGVGYLAGHSSSARAGASTVTHAATGGTASTAAPVKVTLDAYIYGDSVSTPAIYGDGTSVPSIYGDGSGVSGTTITPTTPTTTTTGNTITVSPPAGGTGVVITTAIYGD